MHDDNRPWEIGAPQPALAAVAPALRGRVLDIGCGSGEHTLMASAAGLDATGIDVAPLETAERKARERGLKARFLHCDALGLDALGETFDTALDSLVLHAFAPADRAAYLEKVRAVLNPGGRLFVLCYDRQAGVPHGLSRDELEACFAGWDAEIEPAVCSSNIRPVAGWLAACTRD